MEKQHEYSNGEVTIVWTPSRCIHSGVCARTLPKVYQPGKRPWIDAMAATSDEIRKQVSMCPSRALTYYENKDKENG